MRDKVRKRALRHFTESGVYSTRDHTGILIFISLLERRVEILADKGISEKIPQNEWDDVIGGLITSIRENQMADGLCRAVELCGRKLAIHFPVKPDDTNELSDSVDILES
jgi:putative membrane protein